MRLRSMFIGGVVAVALAGGSGSAQDAVTLVPNTWQRVTPIYTGAPDGGKFYPQLWQTGAGIYDPATQRTCITDRWHDTVRKESIYANAWICYNPATNTAEVVGTTNWRVVKCSQEPDVCIGKPDPKDPTKRIYSSYETHPMSGSPTPVDGHPLAGGIAFDPIERALYRVNGANNSSSYFYGNAHPNETWKMPLATGQWELVADARRGDKHPPRDVDDYVCTFYDPPTQKLIYFDVTNSGTVTWVLDPLTKRWDTLPLDPSAQGVYTAIAGCAYDSRRNRLLVLGGGRNLYNPAQTDPSLRRLRAYSVTNNHWTDLAPPPVPTYAPEFAYSVTHDVALALVTVKQADGTGIVSSYVYLPSTDTWETLPGTLSRGRVNNGHSGTLTYNVAQDRFVTHGGTYDKPFWAVLRYAGVTPSPPPTPDPGTEPEPESELKPGSKPAQPIGTAALGPGIGRGCTTAYFIDEDCDGFGVAVRSSGVYGDVGLGDKPDADDTDPTINTPATVLAAYDANGNGVLDAGELRAFLRERKGITAGTIYYLAPNGNNATGAPNDPTRPYATFNEGVRKFLTPGDVVIFRDGTYVNQRIGGCCPAIPSGTPDKPVVLMAAPGERAIMEYASGSFATNFSKHVIVDGFAIDNPVSPGSGNGISFGQTSDAILRNIEVQRVNFISSMQDMHRVTVDRWVVHHNKQHGIYMGTRELPATDVTVRRSIVYGNGVSARYGGVQFNGRVTNLRVEANIIHSNGQWGVSLVQGVSHSTVQNNLIFNNQGHGIIFQVYPGHGEAECDAGTGTICPYEQNDNLITNNTIWLGRYDLGGRIASTPQDAAGILVGRNNNLGTVGDGRYSQGRNTVQNNIIVTDRGPMIRVLSAEWLDTWTVRNNVVFRRSGETPVVWHGSTSYSLSNFERSFPLADGNVFADPKLRGADLMFFKTPERFSFDLAQGSPAIGFGTGTSAPPADLRGVSRGTPPDAGSFVFGTGGSRSPSSPTNLRIVH